MAGVGLPHEAIREQLGRGLDLVVHLARLGDGSRRVVEVARSCGPPGRSASGSSTGRGRERGSARGRRGADRCSPRSPGGLVAVAAREAVLAAPRLGALARARARAARARRARGLRAERRRAAPARRCSGARALLGGRCCSSPGPGPLAVARGRRARRRAASLVARRRERYRRAVERSVPEVATAIADALSGGRSVRAALARGARLAARARRRPSWRGCAPTSSSGPRPPRRSRRCAAACARRASTRSPRRCSASRSRRRPRRADAAARRGGGRARPGRRRRPRGHGPGALHRPAGGRHAGGRGAVRRAARARLRLAGPLRARLGRAAGRWPAALQWRASRRSGGSGGRAE